MQTELTKDETLRRYLLGEPSDEQRSEMELRFLEDGELFDQLNAYEEELYLEYAAGEMTSDERSTFEMRFVADRKDRRKLAFADAFMEVTGDIAAERRPVALIAEEPASLMRSITAFFGLSARALQVGAAAAMVLLIAGVGYLSIQNARLRGDLASIDNQRTIERQEQERIILEKQSAQAELERQLQAQQANSAADRDRISAIEAERDKLQADIDTARRKANNLRSVPGPSTDNGAPSRSIIALALSPGLVRGSGAANRVALTESTKSVRLTLQLPGDEAFPTYRVVVRSVDDDREIFFGTGIRARGKSIRLDLPAGKLSPADLEITLTGVGADGKQSDISRYYFSVTR